MEQVHPKSLQAIVEGIKGKREEEAISTIMLRSLRQARYSPECSGHFGLAAKYYSHFTSPIRRYPDLQIHRIIK
ncbi:RNB domain-containing ribonuclease, partial [Acinetobacter baumannii]|nr:RNB domain-containing ribonuclease [Acinetobacter baumannii]